MLKISPFLKGKMSENYISCPVLSIQNRVTSRAQTTLKQNAKSVCAAKFYHP